MKVKFANKVFEVLYTMEAAGLTMYAVEDEPNHIDWLTNVEVVDAEKKELKKLGQSEVTKMSDQEEIAEIPFGTKDSELQEAIYYVPKVFHAEIDDDKVVIKKGEKPTAWSEEDEQITLSIEQAMNCASLLNIVPEKMDKIRTWLKSLKQRI